MVYMVVSNTLRSSVWNLLRVTLLAPGILRWRLIVFSKFVQPPIYNAVKMTPTFPQILHPVYTFLLEKLTSSSASHETHHILWNPEISLPRSKELAICLYPGPDKSSLSTPSRDFCRSSLGKYVCCQYRPKFYVIYVK